MKTEKQKIEYYAVANFIRAFNECSRRELTFIKLNPSQDGPDTLCSLKEGEITKEVGIEVSHLYGSGRDARMLLGRTRAEEEKKESRLKYSLVPLNVRILTDLNYRLKEKAGKRFDGKNWLLIRNVFPLWFKNDFIMYKAEILVPENHSYEEIWLLCDRDGSSGLMRLFPGFRKHTRKGSG